MIISRAEFWKTIRAQLEKKHQSGAQQLIDGSASDHADYRGRVGYLKGLADAIKTVDDVMKADNEGGR